MDLDQLLSESGARWRQAQGPAPRLDVGRLVTDQLPTRRHLRSTAIAAAAAVLVTLAASFLIRHAVEPTVLPAPSTPPVGTPSDGIAPGQVTGTWYHTVSPTMARSQYRSLVGDWVLTLEPGGSARLGRVGGSVHISGRWDLPAGTLALTLPVAGCTDAASSYEPERSTLHTGLLVLVPGDEGCLARAILLGGHWFTTPSPG